MLTIEANDKRFTWHCREGETLTASADRHQLGRLFSGCRGGGCGVRQVQVISGSYTLKRHSACALPDDCGGRDIQRACCLQPSSDMVVNILKLQHQGADRTQQASNQTD